MNKITCTLTAKQYISVLRKLAGYKDYKKECQLAVQEILITTNEYADNYTVKLSPDSHALVYKITDEYIKTFMAANLVDNVKSLKELQAALMQSIINKPKEID